jgi:gluconokinase
MAALLGRPLTVTDGAEGTALGAAALGLVALGSSPTLEEAVARLSGPAGAAARPIDTDDAVVAAYDALRHSVAGLVADLDQVAPLFER